MKNTGPTKLIDKHGEKSPKHKCNNCGCMRYNPCGCTVGKTTDRNRK